MARLLKRRIGPRPERRMNKTFLSHSGVRADHRIGKMRCAMRYFFDILSDRHETVDEEGCDLQNDGEMQKEAVRLLAQVASDEAPYGNPPLLTARVRDMTGRQIYRAVLSIEGQRVQ
jgi:hypothetical protein